MLRIQGFFQELSCVFVVGAPENNCPPFRPGPLSGTEANSVFIRMFPHLEHGHLGHGRRRGLLNLGLLLGFCRAYLWYQPAVGTNQDVLGTIPPMLDGTTQIHCQRSILSQLLAWVAPASAVPLLASHAIVAVRHMVIPDVLCHRHLQEANWLQYSFG